MIVDELFPEKGKVVLNANGKEFIERLGIEAVRQVVFGVLTGENIRTQTEPLTRRRVAIATGALMYLFIKGWSEIDDFTEKLSTKALEQMLASRSDKTIFWPAMWLIGLTGKGIQNVLRSNSVTSPKYIQDFENAIDEASQKCMEDFGPVSMNLGYIVNGEYKQNIRPLGWKDISRLSTAIGAATLTIRGSEKSTYGKLFERLVMGSILTILGFQHVQSAQSTNLEKVFWLSDSSDERECDATIRLRPGKLARFDIGFIGRGNPEIMKDKLTRYSREIEQNGVANFSQTFIIVDKMPDTTKTLNSALKSGTAIIQMSMKFWAIDLAQEIKNRLGYDPEILSVPEDQISDYIKQKLETMPLLDFLNTISFEQRRTIREEHSLYRIDSVDSEDEFNDDD